MMTLTKRKSNRGYSLLEMSIVTALLFMTAAFSVNHVLNWRELLLLRFTVESFTGDLSRARTAAIACGYPVEILIGEESRDYRLRLKDHPAILSESFLPDSCTFSSQPRRPVVFYASGNCTPSGTYVITGKERSAKVVISIMGRIRWEFM